METDHLTLRGSNLVALCATADVEPDQPIQIVRDGMEYAVFNLDGAYYVTADLCSHGPGSLAEGFVMDGEIECPFHQGRFDIKTGKASYAPCTEALRVWTVHVVDGDIRIDPGEMRRAA